MNKSEQMPEGPRRLSDEEIKKVVESVDDSRLDSESDMEYFVIEDQDRKIHIPKREKMYIEDRGWVKVAEHIKEQLGDLDSNEQ